MTGSERLLIAERKVRCTDKKTGESVLVTLKVLRPTRRPTTSGEPQLVEFILENDFLGGEMGLPGVDEVHSMGLCLLHIESFLLHMSVLHDVILENGIPFDPEQYSVCFGADQRDFYGRHLNSGALKR